MPIFSWSKTAATNASADSTINYAEGQPPASLNDSGRALMAAVAKWRDDISGAITTTGTSTAYVLATNSGFTSLAVMDKQIISFIPHTTNGANATINIDTLGAVPIRTATGVSVGASVLVQGTPYQGVYYNGAGELILMGFTGNPYNVPIGGVMPFISTTPPNSNFVLMYGQAISRTTYASLFALTSTTWGIGDGVTTFNIPDVRGRAIFGLDNMGGSAANRITAAGGNWDGTVLEATSRGGQNHTLTSGEIPAHTHSGTTGTESATHTHNSGVGGNSFNVTAGGVQLLVAGANNTGTESATHTHSFTTDNGTGGGGAHTIMPPALVLPILLRII